jgi:proteasome accessory factor B
MPPSKTQRWLDLISALLSRRFPVPLERLLEEVPGYRAALAEADLDPEAHARALDSVRRKFERDKTELRRLGIPLETVPVRLSSGEMGEGYRILRRDFYLPLLRVIREEEGLQDATFPPLPDSVALSEEEAGDALKALRRILILPAFPLRREARAALRKLTFDLDPALASDTPLRVLERPGGADPRQLLPQIMEALLQRKRIHFLYRRAGEAEGVDLTPREVEPWGILFQWGGWYVIGNTPHRDPPLRLYRVDRMHDVALNPRNPGTPDFERDPAFHVSRWMDREPWEVGDPQQEGEPVLIRFHPPLDALALRNGWGAALEDPEADPSLRRFHAHRPDPLLRWVLAHGGEAEIIAPDEARIALKTMARRILKGHEPEVLP